MLALFEKARGRLPPEVTYDDVKPEIRKAVQREERSRKAREVFGKVFPCMAVVAVTALVEAAAKVELEATAMVPEPRA